MQIAVVGSGYVGLVLSACFADFGHDAFCIDKDPAKAASLDAGKMPIYQPGLAELGREPIKISTGGRGSMAIDLPEG